MKQFTAQQKLKVRQHFAANNKVAFRKNSTQLEMRSGFFYKHGQTTEGTAVRFLKQLTELGFNVIALSDYPETAEYYNAWPRDSYFQVTFELVETAQETK